MVTVTMYRIGGGVGHQVKKTVKLPTKVAEITQYA